MTDLPPPPPPPGTPSVPPPGTPPPPPPSGGYGVPMPGSHFPQNGLGVWALVLGILSIVCCFGVLTGVPAIIIGRKSQAAAAQGQANNGGLGQAGLITGIIGSALMVLYVLYWVAMFLLGTIA